MNWRNTEELPLGMTVDDLPVWMRGTRRRVDWTMWITVGLCLAVVWPLVTRPGLPRTGEIQNQMVLALEVADNLKSGVIYPRWAADFNYGYGSPLFNYLPPLPHYLAASIHVLFQFTLENSLKVVFVLGIALNGLGMFGFVRRQWGDMAGILAAAVFLFSPQLLLVKPYLQGDLPGLLVTGWFWIMLWSQERMLAEGSAKTIALTSGALAGLWLSDATLSIVLTVIAVGWLFGRLVVLRRDQVRARGWHVVTAYGAGIGAASFFWLPAWTERGAVQWMPEPGHSNNSLAGISWHDLFALPSPPDLSAINPPQTGSISFVAWLLAVLTIVWIVAAGWTQSPPSRLTKTRGEVFQAKVLYATRWILKEHSGGVFWGGLGLICVVAANARAMPIWNALPDWPLFTPQDILLFATGCCALLAAQIAVLGERHLYQRRRAFVGTSFVAGLIALMALPFMIPPEWPSRFREPDREIVVRDEMHGYNLAGQISGWLLPAGVESLPQPTPALIASYQDGSIDKVARDAVPPATQIDIVEHTPQSDRLVVQTHTPVDLRLLTLNFPGWKAEIDDRPVPIATDLDTGLMIIRVPEGQHNLDVFFGETSARRLGWLITFMSVAVIAFVAVVNPQHLDRLNSGEDPVRLDGQTTQFSSYGAFVLLVGLWLGLSVVVPRLMPEAFTVQSAPGVVDVAQEALPRALQGGIDLLAYDLSDASAVKPGSKLHLTLYWRAVRPDLPDYQVNVAVADGERQISYVQHRHPGAIPSSTWPLWPLLTRYVRDPYTVSIDSQAPPGDYAITIQVGRCSQLSGFPCESIVPLFVRDGRGGSLGQQITLPASISVAR